MYITLTQIEQSLDRLRRLHPFFGMSFLAFKMAKAPVGRMCHITFSTIAEEVLNRHYRACVNYPGFYNPFRTSDPAGRWVTPRYGSTSLQRITTDTFRDALLHSKHEPKWGWREEYVEALQGHLSEGRIPAFDLAVWLYRSERWPARLTPGHVIGKLFKEYGIGPREVQGLFDVGIPDLATNWVSEACVSEAALLDLIGIPPGLMPEPGAALRFLELQSVGPATLLRYEPAERLNIITGDNSLGKTFILECVWWALTGAWLGDDPARPRGDVAKRTPAIEFGITSSRGRAHTFSAGFDWDRQDWEVKPQRRQVVPGLVVYARFDGSFAVLDPVRSALLSEAKGVGKIGRIFLTRNDIWHGLPADRAGSGKWLCNGLIRDWITWQMSGDRYLKQFGTFTACLRTLSPSEDEPLEPSQPVRLGADAQEKPTLRMPYGDVPVTLASAGVQRVLALSYVLVWAWYEHLAASAVARREPQTRVVLMIDEVEAHLHPRWQRVLVPALMNVVGKLSSEVSPQLHLATHSPIIMASAEVVFDGAHDDLHHLRLDGDKVVLEKLPFVKRGRVDVWLNSEVFGLKHARSLEGEKAIEEAQRLQLSSAANRESIQNTHKRLVRYLAQDDEFWPRWRFFAKQHGVD